MQKIGSLANGKIHRVMQKNQQKNLHKLGTFLIPKQESSSTRIIFEKLQRILVEQLGIEPNEVEIDSNFIEDLGADSLDIVELIMAVEETFNIEIPDEIAATMKTVRDVVNYINSQL